MRIVIDMQGVQTESRFRGIGRYTLSFALGVVRNRGQHDIFLALNGLFPDSIESIRAAFEGLLPQENIRVWHAPGPVRDDQPGNEARREASELIREAFLASMQPDVIHISSLFEGYMDDAVTSIRKFDKHTPVSVSLYDLIPLLNPDQYLKSNSTFNLYYQRKLDHLRQATCFLAISDFARKEVMEHLDVTGSKVINVSSATEPHFHPLELGAESAEKLRQKFGLTRPFVLYTGGGDERKNLPRLIQAFAILAPELRKNYQLVFAGRMSESDVALFKHLATGAGLKASELHFTGYVSDDELVELYNICSLYVFPSWHEGFGLPALEAMACGAPVIGASTTSLPEVIGLKDALFDPMDVSDIAAKMQRALREPSFRERLAHHGLQQARKFSWDESAKRAISAWEGLSTRRQVEYLDSSIVESRLYETLKPYIGHGSDAYLVGLSACIAMNQQAGIQRQLLVDISELCQHDAATGVQRVVRSYLKWLLGAPPVGFRIEPVYATLQEGYRYARRFTQQFLGLTEIASSKDEAIRWQRGDIFFGLDMQHHVQQKHGSFYQKLREDGVTVKFLVYDLLPIQLPEFFTNSNAKKLHEQLLMMIASTDGAICISKATSDAYTQWIEDCSVWRSPNWQSTWLHIGADIEGSSPSRGVPDDANEVLTAFGASLTFLCVATVEPRKGQQQILEAVELLWARGVDTSLVFVGRKGWKTEVLAERILGHAENGRRLFWLEGISDEYLEKIYSASTCLIAASLNEGFGLPLIEAARHNLPIVARDIPVFREVAGDAAFYFSGGTGAQLAEGLENWINLYLKKQHPKPQGLRWFTWQQSTEILKKALIEKNYPRRQLLVDISELVQRDAKTGIQRVVRSVLKEWLTNPPDGYRVEPVYASIEYGYRYARNFTASFMNWSALEREDVPIDYGPGDIFFGLDLQPQIQLAQREFLRKLRRQGVRVVFTVYDLLCVQHPQYFTGGSDVAYTEWLDVVAESNGVVCISKSVEEEFRSWLSKPGRSCSGRLKTSWFHLGADVKSSKPTQGLPANANVVLSKLVAQPTFLMVGTLEPRKAHAQVLDAFEQLWDEGFKVSLVIVGKQGWQVEKLVERLRRHRELNAHLFWLEGISDEYLQKIYAASSCLIAASYGEGFGLPLIEAAQHRLPIFARNIPVFREVAGEHAYYFQANQPDMLADAIKAWLVLYHSDKHPKSDGMPWLTWEKSASRLMQLVLQQKCTAQESKNGIGS